jgi:glycosyltransferase involved in cell wall biosynthesis
MRRRVVFISDAWEFAGAERYLVVLAGGLAGSWECVALLPDRAPDESVRNLEGVGARVVRVPGLGRRPRPAVVLRLASELRREGPALVHANLTDQGDGLTALAASRLARVPLVATLHVVIPDRTRMREALSRRALGSGRALIAVSEATAAYARSHGLSPHVVRNGLPPPEPAEGARQALAAEAGFLVGGVGRLSAQKGWDVLCRAARLVRRERADAIFVVVGDGEERAELTAEPGCGDVRFLGYRPQASSLLAGMDLLAMPSRFEGLPLVAIEAMHSGVPVVAARVGGVPEVLGECGVLVPPDDPRALADAILALALDEARRVELAGRARERARALFSPERMAAETAAVYEAALAR